jgi:hypothetical protein
MHIENCNPTLLEALYQPVYPVQSPRFSALLGKGSNQIPPLARQLDERRFQILPEAHRIVFALRDQMPNSVRMVQPCMLPHSLLPVWILFCWRRLFFRKSAACMSFPRGMPSSIVCVPLASAVFIIIPQSGISCSVAASQARYRPSVCCPRQFLASDNADMPRFDY